MRSCAGPGPASDQTNLTCTDHKVWSAEWSFGAMTAAKTLADEYEKMNKPDLAAELRADAVMMRSFVMVPTEDGGLNNINFDGG